MEGQSGLSELSVISWVSTVEGCPLSGVPLYFICILNLSYAFLTWRISSTPLGPPNYPVKVSSPYSDDYRATHTSDPPTVPPNGDSPPTRVTPQPQPPPPTTQPQPDPQPPHVYPILPGREGEEIPYYTGGQYPQPTYPRQQRVDEHTRLVNHWADDSGTMTCPHWTDCIAWC